MVLGLSALLISAAASCVEVVCYLFDVESGSDIYDYMLCICQFSGDVEGCGEGDEDWFS